MSVVVTSSSACSQIGCATAWRVVPHYSGTAAITTASFTLLYQLSGANDPVTGNISFTNGRYEPTSGDGNGIAPENATLVATPTQVLAN